MVWQDTVIFIANLVFAYALIPQIWKGFKDKKGHIIFQTGLINTILVYVMAITFFTLGLLLSGIISLVNGTAWLILFIQSIIYK